MGSEINHFIYCRKSSEEDSKQVQSIVTQKRILGEYVKQNDLSVTGVFVEAKTGYKDGMRDQFNLMIQEIKKGKAQGLLVAHLDRIGRNLIESGIISKLFLEGYLKEVRTPYKIYNTVQDITYMEMELVFAADYSRRLSQRVREGNLTKWQRGGWTGVPPIGYRSKNAVLFPDPVFAPIVSKIFQLYSTGLYSIKDITRIVYEDGLRSKKGQKIRTSVIHRMLTNPEYTGMIRRKGNLYKGVHKPLVDPATFNRIQKLLNNKSTGKEEKHTFLYRGYAYCNVCGCKYTATVKKQKYHYYYCTNGKNVCNQHKKYLNEDKIENLTRQLFEKITLNKRMADESFDLYAESVKNDYSYEKKIRDNLEGEIAIVDTKLKKLLDIYLNGSISVTEYDMKRTELDNEKAILENQANNIKIQKPEVTLEQVAEFKKEACNLAFIFDDGDEKVKSDLMKSALWNYKVQDGKIASVQYKKPYSFLNNLNNSDDLAKWRRGRDSNPRWL